MYMLDKLGPEARLPCSLMSYRGHAATASAVAVASARSSTVSAANPQGRSAARRDHPARHRRRVDRDPADRRQPGRHGDRVRAVQRRDDGRACWPTCGWTGGSRNRRGCWCSRSCGAHRSPSSCRWCWSLYFDSLINRGETDGPASISVAIGAPIDRGGGQGPVPAAHDDRPSPQRAQLADRLPGVRGHHRGGFRLAGGHPLHRRRRVARRLAAHRGDAADHGAVRALAVHHDDRHRGVLRAAAAQRARQGRLHPARLPRAR